MQDLKSRRIPNLLTGVSLVCGLGLHLSLGGYSDLAWSIVAGLLAGGSFFVLYLAGGMGAGDVKLMAAVGCIAGFTPLLWILSITVVSGALLGTGIAIRHRRLGETLANTWMLVGHHRQQGLRSHAELNVGNAQALRMPFAVPIAVGCLTSLCLQIGRG
jgi:prepilin peptidase CpaA